MLIDGEKYACDACIRGHRIKICEHSDRPLIRVNKKGRPVSQCLHCRTLRKSRSAHVKCDCGEKMRRGKAGTHGEEGNPEDRCSCIHGGRCSCALKKEHLDPVLESDPDKNSTSTVPANEIRHPRALAPQSQNPLTVFASDHMQGHKYTEMTQTRRLSYVDPEAHATYDETPFGSTNHSIDCLPQLNTVDTFHGDPQIEDSTVSVQQEQRMASSEFGSSALGSSSNLEQLDSLLPPINPSSLDNFTGIFDNSLNFDNFDTIPETDQLFFPADLGSLSNDWSQYDI